MSGVISGGVKIEARLSPEGGLHGDISQEITRKSYNDLIDLPSINDVTLIGNKTLEDLNFIGITPQEIDNIIFGGD